ncbi:serine carboxypeptidase-domain-containing protein [Catenaria anguillulae PL171]|uniref:Serine carboxypeptidase-domain-containing protein n=1 Tax=Catenaria anguillulae PL171 TaxID=765915 RepID=A0A1Y2HJX0_9FUNG|nr:serine carboxypeptidase-domain-containing protein [Catenaria anguillulae PL171]
MILLAVLHLAATALLLAGTTATHAAALATGSRHRPSSSSIFAPSSFAAGQYQQQHVLTLPSTRANHIHVPFVPNAARLVHDHVFGTQKPSFSTKQQTPPPPIYPSRHNYKVDSLPGIRLDDSQYTLYAGHLRVDNLNSTQFFMYYELANKTKDVLVWLNGGPGSSSLFGHFVENGPILVNFTSGALIHNPHGWHAAGANVLFLENPAGVGFSHVDSDATVVKTNDDVGQQFTRFATEFQQVFGSHLHWWISGESFAGMYIPYMAKHVLAHNAQHPHALVRLQGVAIGNGAYNSPWSEPVNWVDFLDAEGLMLNPAGRARLVDARNKCFDALTKRDPHVPQSAFPSCQWISDTLFNQTQFLALTNNTHCLPSTFDIRVTKCNAGDPTDTPAQFATEYLSQRRVALALHAVAANAPARNWTSFNPAVYANLNENADQPSADLLPGLIRNGVRVLLYNGDKDFICNYVGTENMLEKYLEWEGQVGFGRGVEWQTLEGGFGVYKKARGLAYVRALVMVLSPSTIARAYAGLSACALWNTLILSAFQDVGEWRMVYYWAHIAGKVVFAGLAGFLVKYRVQEFVVSGEYGDLVSTVLEAAMAVGYLVLEATTSEWSQGADIKKQLGIRS